jgi:UMF1 family MFS transporter
VATTKRAAAKEIFGWAMFDFANSSYTTVVISVVYCIIFPRIIVGDGPDYRMGNLLWSIALSISYLVVLVSAPLCGAIMDFSASKKKFLFASCLLTVAASTALYWVSPGDIAFGMLCIIVSNTGFSLSESFVSSFLPHLGPPADLGKISGYAWSLGYFGGLLSTAIVLFGLGALTADNFPNLRWVGPITGAFFLIAAIPTFLWLKERGVAKPHAAKPHAAKPHVATAMPMNHHYFTIGIKRLRNTLADIRDYRDLAMLLLSFLFSYAGLSIVISFAFIFGDQVIHWTPMAQLLMFVLTQLTAAAGAFIFGFVQDAWGAKKTYMLTLVIWVIAVILISEVDRITSSINSLLGCSWQPQRLFLVIGSIAGLGLGATQSSCRALVGLFTPQSKSGEFFGLWGLSGKLASIIGLLGIGFLQSELGLEKAIIICAAFFVVAIVINIFVNENRGRQIAQGHEGD